MEAFARSISIDAKAIEAMGQALAKNDSQHKIFIGTSGTLHLKPNGVGTEEDAGILEGPTSGRRKNEQVVLKMKDQGIKSNVVRLSPTCHGKGDEGFSALLVGVAKLTGVSAYPDDGCESVESRFPILSNFLTASPSYFSQPTFGRPFTLATSAFCE